MIPEINIIRNLDGNKLPLPSYSSPYHFGLNLKSANTNSIKIDAGERVLIPIGFALAMPKGLIGMIVSDPTLAAKNGIIVLDAPYIINPAVQESISILLFNSGNQSFILQKHTIIAQLYVIPAFQITWKENKGLTLTTSSRKIDTASNSPSSNTATPSKRKKQSIRNRFKTDE